MINFSDTMAETGFLVRALLHLLHLAIHQVITS